MRDALAQQQRGEPLGLGDAGRAHEHRLASLVPLGDVVDDRGELGVLGLVDEVGLVGPDHRHVRRDGDDAELVGLVQLVGLGLGRAGHAGELLVEAEVVLQGDRGEGLVLLLDLHALFGLDGLVHALVVAPALKYATGELVDDHDLAVVDDVVTVALEQLLRLQRVVQVADQRGVGRLVEVLDAELVLDERDALFGDGDGALALFDLVVDVLLHPRGDAGELEVPALVLFGRPADDQRGAGLVDEDRVDLVDDREVVPALDEVIERPGHVVAQVVEAELVVGAVGDVRVVRRLALLGRHVVEDLADGEAKEAVHPAHPVGVAAREVVVGGDQVHALAGQRVEIHRQGRDQGLTLAGLHLGDVAEVQGDAAHELHLVVELAQGSPRRFAHDGERLGQDVVERLVVGEPLLEGVGERAELSIGQIDVIVFERLDVIGNGGQPPNLFLFTGAQKLG